MLTQLLFQTTTILCLAIVLGWLLKTPAYRAAVCLIAILALPLCLWSAVSSWSIWQPEVPWTASVGALQALPKLAALPGAENAGLTTGPAIFFVWMAVSVWLLLRHCAALLSAWLIYRRATPILKGPVRTELDQLKSRLHISRKVAVCSTNRLQGPGVVGLTRPCILLPEMPVLSSSSYRHVLAHELMHIRRNDWPNTQLARLTLSCFWWHPLAWVCWFLYQEAIELACDQGVVSQVAPPADYAETLVTVGLWSSKAQVTTTAFLGRRLGLARRVRMIMKETIARPSLVKSLVPTALFLFTTVLVVGTVPVRERPWTPPVMPIVEVRQVSVNEPTTNWPVTRSSETLTPSASSESSMQRSMSKLMPESASLDAMTAVEKNEGTKSVASQVPPTQDNPVVQVPTQVPPEHPAPNAAMDTTIRSDQVLARILAADQVPERTLGGARPTNAVEPLGDDDAFHKALVSAQQADDDDESISFRRWAMLEATRSLAAYLEYR